MSLNEQSSASQTTINEPSYLSAQEIQTWLISHLVEVLKVEAETIQPEKDFSEYGLDSIKLVNLSGELESILNCRLDPTVVSNYPTVRLLSEHLASIAPKGLRQPEAEQILANVSQMSDEEVEGLLGQLLAEGEHE